MLKLVGRNPPYDDLEMLTLDQHSVGADYKEYETMMLANDVGLISEAGCPAVADPGRKLVAFRTSK